MSSQIETPRYSLIDRSEQLVTMVDFCRSGNKYYSYTENNEHARLLVLRTNVPIAVVLSSAGFNKIKSHIDGLNIKNPFSTARQKIINATELPVIGPQIMKRLTNNDYSSILITRYEKPVAIVVAIDVFEQALSILNDGFKGLIPASKINSNKLQKGERLQ